jgi:hypothetical protein
VRWRARVQLKAPTHGQALWKISATTIGGHCHVSRLLHTIEDVSYFSATCTVNGSVRRNSSSIVPAAIASASTGKRFIGDFPEMYKNLLALWMIKSDLHKHTHTQTHKHTHTHTHIYCGMYTRC